MESEQPARSSQQVVIQSKLRPPPLPAEFAPRDRVRRLLNELIEFHRVVVVSATAGSGKTTAVADMVNSIEGVRLGWLTLDRTDAFPGRLVTYLEAALERSMPDLEGIGTRALASGIPHPEAAGLLAEAIGEREVIVVLDELERLDEDERTAWAVIESFIRYASSSTTVVLVSRREVPATVLPPINQVAHLADADLRFTVDEAAAALAGSRAENIDAEAAVDATGGWVSGVLFEAWRSDEHVAGMGGEIDPLHGYLSAHVLDQLAVEDRDFLIATSLLEEVSARRAEALGLGDAGDRLARLRAAHIPVTWQPDRMVMRCHPRFREYLLALLERRGDEATRTLRRAHGRLLAAEGHHEDAVEELMRAGAAEEAVPSAEEAICGVVERLDLAVAERWLDSLGEHASTGSSTFTLAELMLAAAQNDFRRGARVGDQLLALGEREDLTANSDLAAALMAWCYGAMGRFDDYEEVLAPAPPSPPVAAARYASNLITAAGDAPRPELTGGTFDALVPITDYYLGRLADLAQPPPSPWATAVAQVWHIAALCATGQTHRALELYEAAREAGTEDIFLATQIGPAILIDARRPEEARRQLEQTANRAREASVWLWVANRHVAVTLALRHDRDLKTARRILDEVEIESQRVRFYSEESDTLRGFLALLENDDETGVTILRRAVDGMVSGDRMLYLPAAAVYLAEAEWRVGEEDAADRAADLAVEAAQRQGSNHLLLQALADFPAVITRRIDAEPTSDSAWHKLGRDLTGQGVQIGARLGRSLQLREFGDAKMLVDGVEIWPSISKSFELLAFLAQREPMEADREALLESLFAARTDDSARAYLRQAVLKLREVLPIEDGIIVEDGHVRIGDEIRIESDAARFENRLTEASRLQGEERRLATLQALEIFDQGEFLPNIQSDWADERRGRLADRARDARHEAADLSFAARRYEEASKLTASVLGDDPYRESSWRLQMRIANALGDADGVISAYRSCGEALAEFGAEPAASTRELLDRMRA